MNADEGHLRKLKEVASATGQRATDTADVARQRVADAASGASALVADVKAKAVDAKGRVAEHMSQRRQASFDWSLLTPTVKMLYCQVVATLARADDVIDPGEVESLDLIASLVGLDDDARAELRDEVAQLDAASDATSTVSTVELAQRLCGVVPEDCREPVFTSIVGDLVRMSRADGQSTDEEREQIAAVAALVFPNSAEEVVEKAEQLVIAEEDSVKRDREDMREFIKTLEPEDIKSGNWFSKLLKHALNAYTKKVNWQYFQDKYKGVPADAIVDQRIKMAARYAEIEGGLSAAAYTAYVAAGVGSHGGAAPVVLPAAVTTLSVDLAYTTSLQLRLAWDVAVLYHIHLDLDDPEDLWKLVRVAFTIKSGEIVREGVIKVVPLAVRPLIKHFFSGAVLQAARALPVVGKYLLQRNVIKIGIPVVGVPLAVVVNRYTTLVAGQHARAVFRNEARLIELAETLSDTTRHPQLLPWVAWLVIKSDDKLSDDEALLMRHLLRLMGERHEVFDERLANLVDLDPDEVWRRVDVESGDLSDILDAARRVAAADGNISRREQAVLDELGKHCSRS